MLLLMLFVYSTCTYWTSDVCQTLRQGPEIFFFKAMYFFDSTEHRTHSHLRIYGSVYFNFACLAHLYVGSYLKVKTYLFILVSLFPMSSIVVPAHKKPGV